MKRRISKWRIAATIAVLLIAALTVYLMVQSNSWDRQFKQWQVDEPVSTSVDFSKPGITSARFIQTCSISHDEALDLVVRPAPDSLRAMGQRLEGLHGKIEITDGKGRIVQTRAFSWVDIQESIASQLKYGPEVPAQELGTVRRLAYFVPFENGEYTLRVTVEDGAAALAGLDQKVVGRYELCGLEHLPAAIDGCLAVCTGMAAFCSGAALVPGYVRVLRGKGGPADETSVTDVR